MIYQTQAHFDSFERFNSHPHGWDVLFSSTATANYSATLYTSVAQGVIINTGEFSSATLQRGSAPTGMRTFAVPLAQEQPFLWRGQEVVKGSTMIFPIDRELFCVNSGGLDIFTLSVEQDVVDRLLASWDLDPVAVFSEARVGRIAPASEQRFYHQLSLFNEFLCKYAALAEYAEMARGVQEHLLESLLTTILPVGALTAGVPGSLAAARVERAVAYMQAHLEQPLAVTEICEYLGCSRRTLEQSFARYAGCSPWQYLKVLRLNQSRLVLLQRGARTSVRDAAVSCGFWHMGQFSADYRKQFAELPSQTLARAKTSRH